MSPILLLDRARPVNPTPHSQAPRRPRLTPSHHSNSVPTESIAELDDGAFVSMCFGASVSERLRLLRNAQGLGVRRPYVLLTVFLGFSKDPYPFVRKEALDGLVGLCQYGVFQDRSLIEGCYFRGVELLKDGESFILFTSFNRAKSSFDDCVSPLLHVRQTTTLNPHALQCRLFYCWIELIPITAAGGGGDERLTA
ncbi:ARM repeat superfamily protein [Euphorbia peplus]|nr:ARM repeat superfamily protein [Euphorbia peplus]